MRLKKITIPAKKVAALSLSLVVAGNLVAPMVSAQTLSPDDLHSIYNDTVWYKAAAGSLGICSLDTTGSSTVSSNVPEPYRTIISAAAAKYNADPNLAAAIFASEHGGSFP